MRSRGHAMWRSAPSSRPRSTSPSRRARPCASTCPSSPPPPSSSRRSGMVRRSKIVRLATREQGIQSAIAKGALRPRSRYGAALQVLSEGAAQYLAKEGRELHTLTAFDVTHLRVGLAGQLDRYSAASAMSEVMLRLAPAAPHAESFDVMAHALAMLEAIPAEAVESYGLRALWQLVSSLGFAPALAACARDGSRTPGDAAPCGSASPMAAPSATRARTSAPPSSCRARRSMTSPRCICSRRRPAIPRCPASRRAPAPARALGAHPPGRGGRTAGTRVMAAAQLAPSMIIGMAGHVDHGKSALVTALTGRPMDRLAEERRRGHHDRTQLRAAGTGPGAHGGHHRRAGSRGLRPHHGCRCLGHRRGDSWSWRPMTASCRRRGST